jgi:hypothetical protein
MMIALHNNKHGFGAIETILVGIVVLVLLGSGYLVFKHSMSSNGSNGSTGAEATIQKFLTDMQDNDKSSADSIQSPALSADDKQQAGNTSFYTDCQSAGVLCTDAFSKSYLDSAVKTTKKYSAANGATGIEDDYTFTTKTAISSGTNVVSIAAVPSSKGWLIDYVNEGGSASGTSSYTDN